MWYRSCEDGHGSESTITLLYCCASVLLYHCTTLLYCYCVVLVHLTAKHKRRYVCVCVSIQLCQLRGCFIYLLSLPNICCLIKMPLKHQNW